jgi:negative regulator of sigma-B (phosphoserine phosphatase)
VHHRAQVGPMTASRGSRRNDAVEWGVATQTMSGQPASGDIEIVEPFSGGVLVGAVDGLGHGRDAELAASQAASTLAGFAGEPVVHLVRRCHVALQKTRGAVMSLASFSSSDSTITWTGVGNVAAMLLRLGPNENAHREHLLVRGGVVGFQLPLLSEDVLLVAPGDTLVFATDGVHAGFAESLVLGAPPQELAERILAHHVKGSDDALVLVAQFLGRTE